MEIKIHNIGDYVVNNYILETPSACIALDTGYPGGCDRFIKRFERFARLDKLKYIVLSHHHDDHAGFLQDLLKHCDAQVVLHPLAVNFIKEGRNQQPPGGGYASLLGAWFGKLKKSFTYPPVELGSRALVVSPESVQWFEQLGLPIKVLFLPGHTADSIGLFLPETGDLFCFDAAMNGILSKAHHTLWIDDIQAFGASWDTMLSLNPKTIFPSHGRSFPPGELNSNRHYFEGRSLISPS